MPKFVVKERRCRDVEYLIEAESEEAALHLDGDILDESGEADTFGFETLGVEEVSDDTDNLANVK